MHALNFLSWLGILVVFFAGFIAGIIVRSYK
jgi:uncharacterized membrane protein YjjP (DUF1212 family)